MMMHIILLSYKYIVNIYMLSIVCFILFDTDEEILLLIRYAIKYFEI